MNISLLSLFAASTVSVFGQKKAFQFTLAYLRESIKFHCVSLKMANAKKDDEKGEKNRFEETSKTWNILYHFPVFRLNRKN